MNLDCATVGTTKVEGRHVRYLTAPPEPAEGPPLSLTTLLLHGLGCTSEVWLPTIKVMAERGLACQVVAPDMPGFGHSKGPHETLGMLELADWAIRFLDDRSLDRVYVAGNSMGCQVALAMARRHPDRISGLVLQGPTTGDRLVPKWRYVTGLLGDAFQETPGYNLRLMKMYSQMGIVRYLKTVDEMLADDPVGHASEVKAPCLIIRGGHDAIVSDSVARRLAAVLPNGVYVPLDHAAHAIEYNNPHEFVDAMINFLQSVERREGTAVPELAASR